MVEGYYGKSDPAARFKRKPQPAPEQVEQHDDLLCHYPGCTNRWTVQGPNGVKCSKHYWNDAVPYVYKKA